MKIALSFLATFVLAAIAGLLVTFAELINLPEIVRHMISKFFAGKASAKSYPLAVFSLLLLSALVELFISFKINAAAIECMREISLRKVLKIGGGFIGAIAGMTAASYLQNNQSEVTEGLALVMFVAIYIIAPVCLSWSLRLLTEEGVDPTRAKIVRWTTRLTCILVAAISLWGIVKYAF